MSRLILTINAGSSSIKFAIFETGGGEERAVAQGRVVNIGSAGTRLSIRDEAGSVLLDRDYAEDVEEASILGDLVTWIGEHFASAGLAAAGHRIVHGGSRFRAPCRLDDEAVEALTGLVSLAPLHEPHNLAPVRLLRRDFPDLPQFGCFDTAFHADNDRLATTFPIPRELADEGLRRYGFHGLSYEYIATCLPDYLGERADGRVVVAHLGNGASMCAMANRRSVTSTMGFTALDGLMMGTRCGAIDPGLVLHLIKERGMSADAVSEMLYHRSGLLGVSGISNDMQVLIERDTPEAREAFDLFVYRVVRELGSLAAALGGLDALVFTAGIGEHAAPVRAEVCRRAAWLGLELDPDANAANGPRITTPDARVPAFVIPTDEDRMIARHCAALLDAEGSAGSRAEAI